VRRAGSGPDPALPIIFLIEVFVATVLITVVATPVAVNVLI